MRDDAYARELLGRSIDVPYCGWKGYSDSDEYITGMVFEYCVLPDRTHGFIIRFPRSENTTEIGLSYLLLVRLGLRHAVNMDKGGASSRQERAMERNGTMGST